MPKAEDSRPRPSAGSFYLAAEEQTADSTLNHQRNFIVPIPVTPLFVDEHGFNCVDETNGSVLQLICWLD